MTVKTGELKLDVQVRRGFLNKTLTVIWPLARHVPIVRTIVRWAIIRTVIFRVGNMPWKRLACPTPVPMPKEQRRDINS